MNLVARTFFAAVVAVVLLVLPWEIALADPDRGRGRQDPPGHSRQADDPEGSPGGDGSDRHGSRDESPTTGEGSPSEGGGVDNGRSGTSEQDPEPEATEHPETSDAVLAVSATPQQIEPSETSTIAVTVRVGSGGIEDADVLVDLPHHLGFRSASHPVSMTGGPLRFDLGALPADSQTVVTIVVDGIDSGSEAQPPVRVALTADGVVLRDEIAVAVGDESESALALSQSSPLLVQVGDSGSFVLTLRNGSDQTVEDAFVVAEIAPELDVVGVAPIVEADAIQLGRSPTGEDIVWTFDEIAPGEEIRLPWTARAVVAGDLEATMSAEAWAADAPTISTTQTTYLGYVRGVRTSGASGTAAPVVEERVVTKLVPVDREVGGAAAAVLPLTGAEPGMVVFTAVGLIAVGAALILSAGDRRRRGLSVAVLAMILTASACVSDPGSSETGERPSGISSQAAPEPSEQEDLKEDEVEDRVLGLRLERDRPEEGTREDPADPGARDPAGSSATTEVVFEEVTTIKQVLVQPEEPAPWTLASRDGDNRVSVALGQGAPTITSSRVISAGQAEELLVSAGGTSSELNATISLRNLADRPMVVRGTLVLEVAPEAGATAELTSDGFDVVLAPGGETSAAFSFWLPPGAYALSGHFRAY